MQGRNLLINRCIGICPSHKPPSTFRYHAHTPLHTCHVLACEPGCACAVRLVAAIFGHQDSWQTGVLTLAPKPRTWPANGKGTFGDRFCIWSIENRWNCEKRTAPIRAINRLNGPRKIVTLSDSGYLNHMQQNVTEAKECVFCRIIRILTPKMHQWRCWSYRLTRVEIHEKA